MMNVPSVFYIGQNPTVFVSKTILVIALPLLLFNSCSLNREENRMAKLQPDTEKEAFQFNGRAFYPALYKPENTTRGLSYMVERQKDHISITFGDKQLRGKIEGYAAASPSPQIFKTKIINGKARFSLQDLNQIAEGVNLLDHAFTVSFKIYDSANELLTAGKQSFTTEPRLEPINTITYGPEIISRSQSAITLEYQTQIPCSTIVWYKGISNTTEVETQNHRITIENLEPDTASKPVIEVSGRRFPLIVPVFPEAHETVKFVFTANSAARGNTGSDQKYYRTVFQKAHQENADFTLFGGNFSPGIFEDPSEAQIKWKMHRFYRDEARFNKPVYTMPGKNEYITTSYLTAYKSTVYNVNKTPAYTQATETVFSRIFETPVTRLSGERDLKNLFNSREPHAEYGSTVFAFENRFLGVIVLNTEYARTESAEFAAAAGGNISGYIAANQMNWFKRKLDEFENNPRIKSVVVCMHSPLFPAAAYTDAAFWYNGKAQTAPRNAQNKPLPGILSVRNEMVKALNSHSKVKAVFSAEPGYNGSISITENTALYPENYRDERVMPRNDLLFTNCGGKTNQPVSTSVPWTKNVNRQESTSAGLLIYCEENGALKTDFFK